MSISSYDSYEMINNFIVFLEKKKDTINKAKQNQSINNNFTFQVIDDFIDTINLSIQAIVSLNRENQNLKEKIFYENKEKPGIINKNKDVEYENMMNMMNMKSSEVLSNDFDKEIKGRGRGRIKEMERERDSSIEKNDDKRINIFNIYKNNKEIGKLNDFNEDENNNKDKIINNIVKVNENDKKDYSFHSKSSALEERNTNIVNINNTNNNKKGLRQIIKSKSKSKDRSNQNKSMILNDLSPSKNSDINKSMSIIDSSSINIVDLTRRILKKISNTESNKDFFANAYGEGSYKTFLQKIVDFKFGLIELENINNDIDNMEDEPKSLPYNIGMSLDFNYNRRYKD